MPLYKANNKTYNIPYNRLQDFYNAYPDATDINDVPLLTSMRIRGQEEQKTVIKEAKKAQIKLSDSEQFENIFLNALDSLKNAWKSTQVASYEFANYLGIGNDEYVDNFIEEKYKEIYEINKNMRDTGKGIVGGFQEGDMADVALGITNALVGVVTTVVPALATKGISLIPQVMAPMYTEYNAEKAARLYGSEDIEASIEKLRDSGELEVALPLALGAASVALERVGIKGIQSHFLRNIKSTRAEVMGKLFLTGNREGLTEYVQGGLNVANISSAKGEKDIPAKVFDHMTDPNKGIEEFVQGFVGGVGMSSAGRALTSAFRDDKDNIIVNDYINLIGSLQQQKLISKTQEGKNAIDKKIKKAEKDFKNFIIQSKEKSQYITKEQSEELLSIIDTKKNLNKKLEDFQKQVKNNQLSKSEFDTIVEDINNSLQAENEKLNTIRVEANKKFLMDDLRTSETAINKILGLEQKTYKTKKEFLDAYNAKTGKNLTLKDIEGLDGVKVDNEIMINVEEAAENNAVTVGSHELLHGILKSSLTSKELRKIEDKNGNIVETDLTVEGEQLIRDFLNTLSKKEKSIVDKRINDNYKYNRDKDGNIISEKAFAQYAEEYLNAYADAAIKNQLTDSILTKIKNFLEKIFNKGDKGYKNLEFKTGEDVKAFLKAYVSDRKKGEFRQQFIEMAQEGAKRDAVVETKQKPRYDDGQVPVKTEQFKVTQDGQVMIVKATTYLDGTVKFRKKGKNDAVFVESGVKDIKPGENITPRQALNIYDEAGDKVEVGKVGDYKTVMNPKMFDRLTPDQQQRVDPKRAKKTAPKKSKTIEKKSLSSAARQQISDSIKEIGGTYSFEGGKKAWDEGGADNAIQEIRENGYLDDLIAAKFKGDRVPVDFVDKVYAELTNHIRNFNPETNDNLFGWINSQLANKAGNVFNREYKTTIEQRTAKDVDDRTKEGEIKVQVAAEEDARIKAFEEEDISPQAEARRKAQADKKQIDTKSKLRQELNIEDGSDVYNKVLETARKVLIRAYDAGKTARQIQRDLTKEASAYLFKQVKNMLGAKDRYIPTIKKLRVSLINSMFTADLVQMERNVPDNEKVFTRFIKNLTSKQEVQDAVDRNELPPSALNTIDKGQSVALYEKVMPTEQQFIDFFDQPLVNPKTGARSGLRGTRKDQLAKYVAASLNFDATMQVAQEPDVAEKRQQMAELRGETMDDTNIQVLSATINRDPSVKFHRSSKKPVVDKNLAYHIKQVLKLDNITKPEDFVEYSKGLVFKVPGQGVTINDPMSAKDKALFAREAYRIRNDGAYERNNDRELDDFVLNGIEKARKDGKVETRGKILENASKDIVNKNTKGKLTDGNGDIYVNHNGVTFGIEVKGGFAQWVSRTLNAVGDTLSFTTKNDTIDKTTGRPFEEAIIEKVLEVRKEINDFLKNRGLNPIKDFNKPLDVNSKEFEILKTFKSSFQVDTTVSLEYVMRDYILNKYSGNNAQSLLLVDFNAYLMETDSESYRNAKIAVDIFNEGKPVEQQIIPLQLNKETDAITVHVSFQVSDSGVMNHRFRPKLDDNQFKKSNVNLFKDAKVAKEFGKALDDAARIINLSKIDKSISNSRPINKYSKTSRGMSAFDFDETLIDKGDNFIIATSPSGKEIKITSAQWPIQGSKLAEQGYTFDFKDFVNVRGGVDGPLLQKLKNRIKKYGAKNNYILTARPPASATAIHGWLKTKGINIPLENITGLGNSTGEAKAMWIAGKYSEGYNDIYFVDDALPNVKAVKNVLDQLDIKGKSVRAVPSIIKQKIKFSKSSLKNTINSPQYKKFRNNIKNRVLYHGGSETINTIRDNNAVWFYLDDSDAAQMWGDGEVYSVKASDIQDMVVIPDLNDVSTFTKHIQEKFNLGTKLYDVREIMLHPKADEIIKEWMEWSAKNDMEYDLGYNLYEKGKVTNGAAVTVLGVIPKNKIQQVSSKFSKSSLRSSKDVKNVFNQLDVKGKSVQVKLKFSKSLDKDFNDIIEDVKGIDSKKRFSNAKGRARGQGKGRFRFFIPPSHEDFVGILYNFIGFGEKGNKHRDFFEKALIRPLNRAYRKLNQAKQAIASNYKELLKSMPDVRRRLGDKILKGDYTVEDAIRVYLFDKAGHEIPGLSKTDLKNLTEYVKSDPMLQSFADTIGEISQVEEGYISPGDSWQASNIRYDLVDATGRVGRAKFFAEFQENADIIFSDENINKIRAAFGDNVVESLQDILYRTKTGTNRPTGNNRIVNRFMDWINGSVGATMFFNARSAVLQTLSTVNFLNFGDNNLFKAAKAFANQKQFWADFSFIFNSDYLKQRRTGAAFDVNANEIAREVAGSKNPVLAAIKYLLNIGFLPTQIADSFAIATGGATFYRNRVNTYIKQGLSQKEAESKAFIDFQAIAEETQQSARPDMISSQQASPLGRVILAFQNVTAQYARLIKKASLDLINRRKVRGYQTQWQSDLSNVSRIIYYGGIQNLIFYGLQTALFAMMFDDEDEKDEKFFKTKKDRIINGTVDSILRGIGVGGAVISTIKNAAIKWRENQGKGWNKEDNILMLELLQLSPPIGIKARKLRSFEKTMQYNEKVIKNMDIFDFDNPIYSGYSNLIEAVTNIPVARLHRKVENLRAALDSQNQWWQRLAVGLGWSKWDVGVENTEIQEVRQRIKETNKQINKETKLKKKYPGKTKQEIDILETEKTVFDLNKREQERILKQNGLNPKSYRLEKDRVNAIMKLRNKNKSKIDKQISDIENFVPSKSEQRELDLFKMNKKEQVNMLMDLGLSSKEIKKLKYEEDRVNKILALEKKSKKR